MVRGYVKILEEWIRALIPKINELEQQLHDVKLWKPDHIAAPNDYLSPTTQAEPWGVLAPPSTSAARHHRRLPTTQCNHVPRSCLQV
jgi:hypothetical protein